MSREWETEPDELDFKAEGLQCAMRRGPVGSWCGYVGVSPEHPWYGMEYNSLVKQPSDFANRRITDQTSMIELFLHVARLDKREETCTIGLALEVHGGITYSADHLPVADRGANLFWFGFDCAHSSDLVPGMIKYYPHRLIQGMIYRNQSYVVAECQSLARQLVSIMESADAP